MPTRFERLVQLKKTAVAVSCADGDFTYDELNRRANRLAHELRLRGVKPHVRVGICLERSPNMVVAVLATLKAGGAYVPFNPAYPVERLNFMAQDSAPALVLVDQAGRHALQQAGVELLISQEHASGWASHPTADLGADEVGLTLNHPAYVIYTLGSTGQPKGVVVRHRELSNYLSWACELYQGDRGVGAPINTSLSFDATVTSLYVPLLCGTGVILLDQQTQIERLAELLASGAELTLVKLTPAHLQALQGLLGERAAAVRARVFVVGGEALRGDVADYWKRHAPELRIFNEYGPTETVVGCSVHEVPPDVYRQGDVPIGRPTPNTRLYVLDEHREPVPTGSVANCISAESS